MVGEGGSKKQTSRGISKSQKVIFRGFFGSFGFLVVPTSAESEREFGSGEPVKSKTHSGPGLGCASVKGAEVSEDVSPPQELEGEWKDCWSDRFPLPGERKWGLGTKAGGGGPAWESTEANCCKVLRFGSPTGGCSSCGFRVSTRETRSDREADFFPEVAFFSETADGEGCWEPIPEGGLRSVSGVGWFGRASWTPLSAPRA